ncbi:MAG: hypothetical protein QOF83_900 [Solirubrobacteraceae bacterium]|nr:hypothetical protein [Solirubrobacteraceae bacterium]
MRMIWPQALSGLLVAGVCAALAPAASASISPTLTLNQSAGTRAASIVNLGLDLKFAPNPVSDSAKDMTLNLPPGLLANAAIDGGACLNSSAPNPACQVGSGTVTATPFVLGLPGPAVPVTVSFDLVAPPSPADLAGLIIMANNPITGVPAQLGSPGEITVSPAGAVSIAFHGIPNTYALLGPVAVPIAVDEIKSTFNGLRMPTRCPSPAARFGVTADSYGSASLKSASAPLQVTGCSGLPFSPLLSVSAVKDSADNGVRLTTDVTQSTGQATSRITGLAFPAAVVSPNAAAVVTGGLLCTNLSFASCKTIGIASAKSPLYPRVLAGKVYLTGSLAAPAITVTFPPPFALTLNGKVSLATNTTTFSGVPDLPLSDLKVQLSGGPEAAFATTCATPSGDAVGSFTSQDGDLLATSTAPFTVTGCPASSRGGGSSGGGSGGGTGAGSGSGRPTVAPLGLPSLASATLTGLKRGRPVISFKLTTGPGAPKLTSLTVPLPRGLAYVRHRVHRRSVLQGVTVGNAKVKSLSVKSGRLTITLVRPSATVLVKLATRALHETAGLRRKARRGHVRFLKLTVAVTNTAHQHVTLTRAVKPRS